MDFRKRISSERSITILLILIFFLISQTEIPSQNKPKCKVSSNFDEKTKRITYTVECDTTFTDFHIRFNCRAYKPAAFTSFSTPTGWDSADIYSEEKEGNIVVSWKDKDGKDGVEKGHFVLENSTDYPVTAAGSTDWEVTCDSGKGSPFDDDSVGVIAGERNDPDLEHLVFWEPEPGSNFCLSIGPKGGWNSWALDDFDIPKTTSDVEDFDGSFSYGFDISAAYQFPNSHMLGLKSGYTFLPGGTYKQSFGLLNTKLDLSASVIPVELFYKLPVQDNLFIKLGGGIDFYNSTIDYESTITGENIFTRGELNDKGTGFHLGLGTEYFISDNVALTFDACYSSAKLDDFKGSLINQEGINNDMLLTMAYGEEIEYYLSAVPEPVPQNFRPAEIDLSGFQFSIGINYTLFE